MDGHGWVVRFPPARRRRSGCHRCHPAHPSTAPLGSACAHGAPTPTHAHPRPTHAHPRPPTTPARASAAQRAP
eukprot:4357840-Prymnesium_polylepis.1